MKKYIKEFKNFPITFSLILLSIVVYIISVILYGFEMNVYEAINIGAYNGVVVFYTNEYFRIISANFIHFGILHLLMNCYSLKGIGCFIESIFSCFEFLIIVLISAISTTGISYILYLLFEFESNAVSAGISGIVFGMVGSLFALSLIYKDIFSRIFNSLLPNLIIIFLLSIVVNNISLSGHIFGMLGGFISTMIILLIKKKKRNHIIH